VTATRRCFAAAGRWLVASMVCALVAHAAVYRSLIPDDGLHGYFGWYVPLVAVASAGSLLALIVGGVRHEGRAARLIGSCLPARSTAYRCRTVASLAAGGLGFLVVQESAERSLGAGTLSLVTFDASTWPVLLVVLLLAAAAVFAVGRTAVVCSERTIIVRRFWAPMARVSPCSGIGRSLVRKSALLGLHAGLRAPPLAV